MMSLWTVLIPLVQKGPDPADVKPGWLGLGVVLALGVAVVLLWLPGRQPKPLVPAETPLESLGEQLELAEV